MSMAQLLKSLDYISRYESNPFHYSNEFIRLKQENWAKLLNECENQRLAFYSKNTDVSAETLGKIQEKHSTYSLFKKHQANKAVLSRHNKEGEIESKTDLMHYFLNQLCSLHIKKVSSILIQDRKSTRLNSSHVSTSYAVFCVKKNKRRYLV